jgi:hypothetical protein
MGWPFESVDDLSDPAVRLRRYGVIDARKGSFRSVHFRPFPKLASLAEAWLDRALRRLRKSEDRCWLYFNEPRSCPGFLTLAYFVSTPGTSLATIQAALGGLDEIAKVKGSDAIVCDASNSRLSDRMMARYGFEKHAPTLPGHHFIKRFEYESKYASLGGALAGILDEERLALGEVVHA